MSLTCCDCRSPIQRRHKNGPPPKRCEPCKKKKACRQAKAWAAANPQKARYKKRPPRHAQCVDCQRPIDCCGKRGPLAKRCGQCHAKSRRTNGRPRHCHVCKICAATFTNGRKTQHACSPQCRKEWANMQNLRKHHAASTKPCANPNCSKTRKRGTKYCSTECSHARFPPPLVCHNPKCGRTFRMKHATRNPWQNKGKYCCPECYRDHRWGTHRPRQKRSASVRRAAGKAALATSLRKRCKVFGVTFDPACTRQAVLERDGWRCQKCHVLCNKEYKLDTAAKSPHWKNAEHDHIVPLSVPGSPGNVFENSQCLCRRCNSKKSDKPEGQLRLCLEEEAWGRGVRVRRQQNLRSSGATLAAAP